VHQSVQKSNKFLWMKTKAPLRIDIERHGEGDEKKNISQWLSSQRGQ
jgi:hypothetical protein